MAKEPKLDYNETLFLQRLKRSARPDGTVTLDDISDAFWTVAWDLELAIIQQRPEELENARARFRSEMAPRFVGMLPLAGLRLREETS